MNPDTIAAIERQDREIIVAGNDMQEALLPLVAASRRRNELLETEFGNLKFFGVNLNYETNVF